MCGRYLLRNVTAIGISVRGAAVTERLSATREAAAAMRHVGCRERREGLGRAAVAARCHSRTQGSSSRPRRNAPDTPRPDVRRGEFRECAVHRASCRVTGSDEAPLVVQRCQPVDRFARDSCADVIPNCGETKYLLAGRYDHVDRVPVCDVAERACAVRSRHAWRGESVLAGDCA